jgi:ferric-dicitrate binding protein FerR (iron transport regulator)
MTRQSGCHPVSPAFSTGPLGMFTILIGLLTPVTARAQGAECMLRPAGASPRQVLHCTDGLTLEAEVGADYALVDRDRDGRPDAVNLRSRAILLEVEALSRHKGFQVLTPQAIAAVRGTRWAVDAGEGKTAVFVLTGEVTVRRPTAGAGVTLGPGEGVDVSAGTEPLTVRRWPAARANALLARFGLQLR